jgi:hypothetical protein
MLLAHLRYFNHYRNNNKDENMFDPRTDLPASPTAPDFSGMSMQEAMRALCDIAVARQTPGSPEQLAFERKKIDELADFIEQNCLDDLTSMGCVDSFSFLAEAYLDQDFPDIRSYEKRWRTAAASQVWYKYNH